jgi:hypothetical protein
LISEISGRSRAHAMPCGTGNIPQSGEAKPCTAPSFAFASASPPQRLATAMSRLASRSLPSRNARRSAPLARCIPSRATASDSGFACGETNGSMHCVSASSPVLAVTEGGSEYVSSGSITATAGSISGLRRLTFTCSSSAINTAFRVTSAPVPAVVGIAMNGAARLASGRALPMTSR